MGGAARNSRRVAGRGEQFVEIAVDDLSVVPTNFPSCTEHTIIDMLCGRGWVVKVHRGSGRVRSHLRAEILTHMYEGKLQISTAV